MVKDKFLVVCECATTEIKNPSISYTLRLFRSVPPPPSGPSLGSPPLLFFCGALGKKEEAEVDGPEWCGGP